MDIRQKVCRTCLRGDFPLSSLDLKLGDKTPARKMLEFLLGGVIEHCEDFQEICEPCRRDLSLCYYFKHQCMVSEEKVKEHIRNTVEIIPEPPIMTLPVTAFDSYNPSSPLMSDSHSEISSEGDWSTEKEPPKPLPNQKKPVGGTRAMRRKQRKFNLIEYANSLLEARKADDDVEFVGTYSRSRERQERPDYNRDRSDRHQSKTSSKYEDSKGLYTCKKCGKTFNRGSHRLHHMRAVHGYGKYLCPFCGKSYPDKNALITHKMEHKNNLPHECSFCQNRFKTLTELRDHMDTHLNETDTSVWGPKLPPAMQTTSSSDKDDSTEKKSPKKSTENFVCEVCKNSYAQIDVLRFHMRITHPEHGNAFKTLTELRDHMDTHLNETDTSVWGPKLPPAMQTTSSSDKDDSTEKKITQEINREFCL
uniref:C2H2-type domain-containing protein n=1 Tax=Lutzomyia longipalpis TaxID=7200 RepID=A0A1B0CWV9_LUTLO